MQELKMQNGLLLQLINSKNRQNTILFQQYEQLAQHNSHLQQQIDTLKIHHLEYKRQSPPSPTRELIHPRLSPFDIELSQLKNKCTEYQSIINELKKQLEQRGGKIVFLQSEIENAKLRTQQRLEIDLLKQRLKEGSELLQLKEKSLAELTEYMNEQAEKIADLTRTSILTIQNYQAKLAEKDQSYDQLSKRINELQQQLNSAKQEVVENEKVKELQAIIISKQQSTNQLSQFLQTQSQKINQLQIQLTQSHSYKQQVQNLQQIIVSKEQSVAQLSEFLNTLSAKNQQAEQQLQLKQGQLDQKIKQYDLIAQTILKEKRYEEVSKGRQEQFIALNQLLAAKQAEISDLRLQLDQKVLKLTLMQNISQQNQVDFPQDTHQQPKKQGPQKDNNDCVQKQKQIQQLKAVIQQKSNSLQDFTEFISQQTDKIVQLQRKCEHIQAQYENKSNQKIQELSKIIQSKEQSISELRAFLTEAYQKNANLQAQSLNQQQQIQQQAPQDQNLDQDSGYQQQIESLRQTISEKQSECKQLKQQIGKAQQVGKQLVSRQRQLMDQINELQSNLASKCDTIAQLSQYMNEQAQQLEQLRNKVSYSTQNIPQDLQQKMFVLNMLHEKQNQLSQLNQSLTQLKANLTTLEQEKTSIQKSLSSKIEEKQADVNDLLTLNEKLVEQMNIQNKQRLVYEQTILIQDQKINMLTQGISQLKMSINQRNGDVSSSHQPLMNEQVAKLKQLINDLQATIQSKEQTFTQLSEYMNEQSLRIEQLQQKLKSLQGGNVNDDKIKELQQILKSKEQSLAQLTEYLQQTINKNMQLQEQFVKKQSNVMEPRSLIQEQTSMPCEQQHKQSIQINQLKLQSLISQINNKQQDLKHIGINVSDQTLHLSFLKQEIQSANSIVESLTANIDALKKQHQSLIKSHHLLKEQHLQELQQLKAEKEAYQNQFIELKQQKTILQQEINIMNQERVSLSALKEQSLIMVKNQAQYQITINKLQDQIMLLREENRQKQIEMQQVRTKSNNHFVKELNNLLDSCTVNKQGEDIKEVEQELQRVTYQRDQVLLKCKEYQNKIDNLQRECLQLTTALQIANKYLHQNRQKKESAENSIQQDSMHSIDHMERKLLKELQSPIRKTNKKSSLLEQEPYSAEKLRHQNEELLNQINDKNIAINELEETLLTLEKGYNNEIMNLRKSIAELNNESIALKKCLYQANPNGIDVGDLIKDTFSLAEKDTQFYKPDFPLYTQNLFYAQPVHSNHSYYSQVNRVKSNPRSKYQRFYPVKQLNMGEKFMGRRCRQASPFGAYYQEQSRVANSAWEISEMHKY